MTVATWAGALAAAVLLAACTAAPESARDAITDVYVSDFRSAAPASCRPSDVALTHAQARSFFLRAGRVDYKTLQDNYEIAPCNIEGTLKRNGEACEWKIRPGATGSVRCGSKTDYFVCETCKDLFGR
ncbi:hypothetical protein [Variovorax sp. dw_308]|uniref:hypothetical protein n=1 Tax=Variovorax sp. dw_308 TaxID=2721546 RepID=UPI00210A14AB|nr:hypothetical protein [Variovorax sp. dw_308]